MNELALFAGIGGGILGGKILGWKTVCAVENEEYPRSVLVRRQNDGCLDPFPIWDDVRTFDGRPWRGIVDVVSGGFPCQDISIAGKGAGIEGSRSGLWGEMARIIGEVRPRFVFVENSPMLVSRGLTRVLSDLSEMGYDARWCIVGAHHVAAPHKRNRLWILACPAGEGLERHSGEVATFEDYEAGARFSAAKGCEGMGDSLCVGRDEGRDNHRKYVRTVVGSTGKNSENVAHANGQRKPQPQGAEHDFRRWTQHVSQGSLWLEDPAESTAESRMGRVADGVSYRMDKIKGLGNAQVPLQAAFAWSILTSDMGGNQ